MLKGKQLYLLFCDAFPTPTGVIIDFEDLSSAVQDRWNGIANTFTEKLPLFQVRHE